MLELQLRERGKPLAISPNDWRRFDLDSSVGALSNQGILRVERTAAAVLLFPSNFVGSLNAPDVSLKILPKDERFLEAIDRLALEFESRQASHLNVLQNSKSDDDLVTPFVVALSRCVEEGVPWTYNKRVEATSRPRGKPYLSKTISTFAGKGILHRIFAGHSEREQLPGFSRLVWTAFRCLPNAPGMSAKSIQRAGLLIEALDVPSEISVDTALSAAKEILASPEAVSPTALDLVEKSVALIVRATAQGYSLINVPSGAASFVNLEKLWEKAVAVLVDSLLPDSVRTVCHGLSKRSLHLFSDDGPVIDPDIVCFDGAGRCVFIADAKYKILGPSEARGIPADLYQITCYVERTKATHGVLVYVGSADSVINLGPSLSGAQIIVVRISPDRLLRDGEFALHHLLSPRTSLCESVG